MLLSSRAGKKLCSVNPFSPNSDKRRHAVHAEPVTFLFFPCHKCAQRVTFVCK